MKITVQLGLLHYDPITGTISNEPTETIRQMLTERGIPESIAKITEHVFRATTATELVVNYTEAFLTKFKPIMTNDRIQAKDELTMILCRMLLDSRKVLLAAYNNKKLKENSQEYDWKYYKSEYGHNN